MRIGLGKLLEQSDTLVVATAAALGWGVTQYVTHVDRRFDAVDRRFDAADKNMKERFDAAAKMENERIAAVQKTLDTLVSESRSRRW